MISASDPEAQGDELMDKRYALGYYHGIGGESGPTMDLRSDGDWVRYTDHKTAIDSMRTDAMRYRWMADRGGCPFAETDPAWDDRASLDAAIDESMQAESK